MTIDELIEEGYKAKEQCIRADMGIKTISGEAYTTWLMQCSQKLISEFEGHPLAEEFVARAKKANGNHAKVFDELVGILRSFKEYENNKCAHIEEILRSVLTNFHRMARSICNRHGNRATLRITDEYDVQDLLQGILRLFVDDVRPEDATPSYAGGNSRIDFFLPEYKMYIETKKTRDGLTDKKIGEELLIDIGRYRNACDTLVCFIYDPDNRLSNPYGLIGDLEKMSTPDLRVKVYISPL